MSSKFLDEKILKKLDRELQQLISRRGVDRKTLDEVFDKPVLLSLGKLISDEVIDILDFPISTGKEANIFRGVTPEGTFVAVKIYRTSTQTFKHISKYIVGDPRFKSSQKNRREVIFEWAKKEFINLERAKDAGVRVPSPIRRINNIVVMEYIGGKDKPAPMLKDISIEQPQDIYNTLISFMTKMYRKAGLVHADFSAYNVLIYRKKPYLIDLGQAVVLEHPLAQEFLKRDIHNIVHYFNQFGIHDDENAIYEAIVKKT